ncbi:MAG: hypothetical protein ABGW90_04865, partial [Martelella sp.]
MTATDTTMTDGVWLTVAELARRKGVTRQSMTGRVDRLESEGRISTRRNGRSRMVELVTYDRAVGEVGDAAREIGAEMKRNMPAAPAGEGLTSPLRQAQAERAAYDAKLKALDYAERTGALLPVRGEHGVETALVKAADALLRQLDAPLDWVDVILDAAREGQPALRRELKKKIREQKTAIAGVMAGLA